MADYLIPNKKGFFWAKLVEPNDSWYESPLWEVVEVWDDNRNGEGDFLVSVPGVSEYQVVDAFIWGPEVTKPKELK